MPKGSRRAQRARDAARTGPRPLEASRTLRGMPRTESAPDGDWQVVETMGSDKTYRCPGCAQEIPPGIRHLVTWPAAGMYGAQASVEDRRHWHTSCWRARARRR